MRESILRVKYTFHKISIITLQDSPLIILPLCMRPCIHSTVNSPHLHTYHKVFETHQVVIISKALAEVYSPYSDYTYLLIYSQNNLLQSQLPGSKGTLATRQLLFLILFYQYWSLTTHLASELEHTRNTCKYASTFTDCYFPNPPHTTFERLVNLYFYILYRKTARGMHFPSAFNYNLATLLQKGVNQHPNNLPMSMRNSIHSTVNSPHLHTT